MEGSDSSVATDLSDTDDVSMSEGVDLSSVHLPLVVSPSIAGDREIVVHPEAPASDAPLWHRIQFSNRPIGIDTAIILATEDIDDHTIPPPLAVAINGDQNVRGKLDRKTTVSRASLRRYDTLASDYDVETIPMADFIKFLENYIIQCQSTTDPEESMAMLQANPGHLLPLIDGNHPANYDILTSKLPEHLFQRCIQPRITSSEFDVARTTRTASAYPSQPIWQLLVSGCTENDMRSYLHEVLDKPLRPLAWAIARVCQYLQINFNQAKIFGLLLPLKTPLPAATLPANPHVLWTDATICALARSELGDYLLTCAIPHALRDAITILAEAHPLRTHHLGCSLA
ncbi:hypothetical protein DYB32_009506 [Aphanomyces invadans]|uniref:Uncharacterized protein n=1 Tax=Aphanomyces invadans TaxID=157072 RepID=A0A3R6Y1E5_9STRA|nr:hypothetical protein DYB32_009506 [Aphanomyces invadans]